MRILLAAVAAVALQGGPAYIPYDEARPILAAHGRDVAPRDWPAWAASRDAGIRARLARGDEDSLVYLWLYGTSFTRLPRATEQQIARLGAVKAEALLLARLDDLAAAIASPGSNQRLRFARAFLAGKGLRPESAAGRERVKLFLVAARERVIAENRRFRLAAEGVKQSDASAAAATYSTLYRDRGLSSDTRLTAGFAIDKALAALAAGGLEPGGVRRAAIAGPGLDFTDKAEGYDFYPPQTIQPFALADSLLRLGLAERESLRLSTLDLSPRVNAHLDAAGRAARAGRRYTVQLPLAEDPRHEWQPELVAYWRTFGSRVGRQVPAAPLPSGMAGVRLRSVSIDPAIVRSIAPHDVNIIVQRLPLGETERFDLIVATNILVYYDAFEQALAVANIAAMLRPGGYFLTNYAVAPSALLEAMPDLTTAVYFDRQNNGDTIFCYRRRQAAAARLEPSVTGTSETSASARPRSRASRTDSARTPPRT